MRVFVSPGRGSGFSWRELGVSVLAVAFAAGVVLRARDAGRQPIAYVDVAELEAEWGRLVGSVNAAIHFQRSQRVVDRIGFFHGADGTVWGLPLADPNRYEAALACAPAELREAAITDSLPSDAAEILGASDFLADASRGTAAVQLLVRSSAGGVRWVRVEGSEYVSQSGTACREPPKHGRHRDPLPRYHYFRLAATPAR